MLCTVSGNAPRDDLAALSDESSEHTRLFVIHSYGRISTEPAHLAAGEWSPALRLGHGHTSSFFVSRDVACSCAVRSADSCSGWTSRVSAEETG